MLFIPIFGDQLRNALKSVATGNALMLPYSSVTIDSFSAILDEMLSNEIYFIRAKELARTFNDNLVPPMEEAIFWIEYVIRSNGAKHLKSNAVNMPLFSYLLLDILVLPIVVILVLFLVAKALRGSSKTEDKIHKKKRNSEKKTK